VFALAIWRKIEIGFSIRELLAQTFTSRQVPFAYDEWRRVVDFLLHEKHAVREIPQF